MKILNIGSMNLDYVYQLDHIVKPGETESSSEMNIYLGGKGINQSIALAKAGMNIYHAGLIGEDGDLFLEACRDYGVHSDFIRQIDGKTGHTIIQVDAEGQNCILLYGGANRKITKAFVDEVLENFDSGDILVLQNEINLLDYIVNRASEKGMQIALNPSPYDKNIEALDLNKIDIFLLNEVEGAQISGKTDPDQIIDEILLQYPKAKIVLTLGKDGAVYADAEVRFFQPIFEVKAVDTTAAGDTFTGYFLSCYVKGYSMGEALKISAKASSIAVSRRGAVPSIPLWDEVMEALS